MITVPSPCATAMYAAPFCVLGPVAAATHRRNASLLGEQVAKAQRVRQV